MHCLASNMVRADVSAYWEETNSTEQHDERLRYLTYVEDSKQNSDNGRVCLQREDSDNAKGTCSWNLRPNRLIQWMPKWSSRGLCKGRSRRQERVYDQDHLHMRDSWSEYWSSSPWRTRWSIWRVGWMSPFDRVSGWWVCSLHGTIGDQGGERAAYMRRLVIWSWERSCAITNCFLKLVLTERQKLRNVSIIK